METNIFDEVTKAIATATSRRQALRRIGGILGGTALAGLFPGLALADNSGAAHFCNTVFDPGPDRGKCKSDAAHHTGLYYNSNCGGNPQSVCCPTNPDGTCTSYSSATCCGSGQTCTNGACVASCPAGQVLLSNGTCATPCSQLGTPCGSCGGSCATDASGALYCANLLLFDGSCTTDSNCPQGYFCYIGDVCFVVC